MDIKLRNFGKIKEADIQLSGLTLIAGPNDSGKSTVGKALFAIIKSIANYPDYFNQVNSEKLYREYLKPLRLELREIDRLIMLSSRKKSNVATLFDEPDIDKNKLQGLLENIRRIFSRSMMRITDEQKVKLLTNIYNNVDFFRNKETVEELIKNAIAFLNKGNDAKGKIQLIASRIFQDVFEGSLNNSVHKKDVSLINFESDGSTILSLSSKDDTLNCNEFNEVLHTFSDATLIDNPFLLENDYNNYNDYKEFYTLEFDTIAGIKRLDTTTDLVEKERLAAKKLNKDSYYEDLLVEFKKVFSKAQFKYSTSDNRLKYKVNKTSKELEISNIASGCKSFGLLYILLKTGVITKDSLIVFDEPENHLHPEWQIKYAEIICKMVKNGFYVLLTSHSPYMIQALKTYSEKEGIFENKVNFYFAAPDTKTENYSIIENVRDSNGNFDDSKIFKSLYAPIEELNSIYAEIYKKSTGGL